MGRAIFGLSGKESIIREFQDGNGLFQEGIKKILKIPSIEDQISSLKSDPRVEEFDILSKSNKYAIVDLGNRGRYKISLTRNPKAWRLDKRSYANPYIDEDYNNVCLGSGYTIYNRMLSSKCYSQCIKILMAILSSPRGHGYRSWSSC
jgi:hypothetical protein